MKCIDDLRRTLLISVLTLLASGAMMAQNGVTLIDTLNRSHGVSPQSTRFSACWGWVSPDGREYAFIGAYTGTSIIDLNASPIREVQFVPGNNSTYCYREIKTYEHYAYIVSEGGRGVQIVDLSRLPDSVRLVREFNYVSGTKNTLTSHTVTLADGYLYLNGSSGWSPGGTIIFSLKNDPTNPEYVGQYEPEYIHDSYVRNDTMYAAAIYSGGGLHVVDVHNKSNPQLIRKISYTGSGTHHAWASVGGRYALTTDEIGTTPSSLKVWDLQNLGSGPPYTPMASYRFSPTDLIHNVHGRGNYAYISHYTAGMRVVDVHNPATPTEAGGYDTYPGASGNYNGCWGVYPYFPSGRWIGSDMQTGLYLCTFAGLLPRSRSQLLAPANNVVVSTSATTTFRWRRAASMAEDPHYYKLHIWGPGVDTLISAADTSLAVPALPGFQNARLYNWHVWINDEFTSVSSRDTFHFSYGSQAGVVTDPSVPERFALFQNYPNPFNPSTQIEYDVAKTSDVSLQVFNILGEQVAELVSALQSGGRYRVAFNGEHLSSGLYVYRVTFLPRDVDLRRVTMSKKLLLVK
jgi:choice-of-anchor B domain-containing protein